MAGVLWVGVGPTLNPEILLAGSIGALGVFVLTTLKDWVWARRLRRTERKGLLRLVFAELSRNESNLRALRVESIEEFAAAHLSVRALNVDTWEQARVRMAVLLGDERFRELAEYYMNVHEYNDMLNPNQSLPQNKTKRASNLIAILLKQSDRIKSWILEP